MMYFDQLCKAMQECSKDRKSIFIGQGVGCAGTTMTDTLKDIPQDKLLEFPVAEDLQLGFALGLSLEGHKPICVYPRWNFMLCAANQLVNHLDRIPIYSKYKPKVIIRVAVPITHPFNPGPQHDDDFTDAFRSMLRTVKTVTLKDADEIVPAYQSAMADEGSTILVEYTELYKAVPSGVGK